MNAPNFLIEKIFSEAIELPVGKRLQWVREKCGEDLDSFDLVMNLVRGFEKNRQDNFLQDPLSNIGSGSLRKTEKELSGSSTFYQTSCTSDSIYTQPPESNSSKERGSTCDRLGDTTAAPPIVNLSESQTPVGEKIGDQIGRYKLIEKIGEGGMGTVYLAQQTSDVHRKVALKIIKLGMDTQQVCNRFETERQAMAMFNHPHIARVLDAGSTDSGRPYFVMEWVQGTTLTKFCNDNKLNLKQRLDLFTKLCEAVRHAHEKGIIHRDLKPGNILVSVVDGKFHPKVIDFGIAKALDGDLYGSTSITGASALIGTPQYMSPEQAKFGQVEIDRRTDVYSLGIVLFELVSGKTPLDGELLKNANPLALSQTIENTNYPNPSLQLRKTNFGKPFGYNYRAVKGDLDNVINKAISFDIDFRYESVDRLLNDIRNVLAGKSVEAKKPSVSTRILRTLSRHRNTAAAVTFLIAFAMISAIFCFHYADQAHRSDVAYQKTVEKLNSHKNQAESLGKKLEEQVKENEIVGEALKTTSNQLVEVTSDVELKEKAEHEEEQYQRAHLNAMKRYMETADFQANEIQFRLLIKHFGSAQAYKMVHDLYTVSDSKDAFPLNAIGFRHLQRTTRNEKGEEVPVPQIQVINRSFEELGVLNFRTVNPNFLATALQRIDSTIEIKSSTIRHWSDNPPNQIENQLAQIAELSQHYFRDQPALSPEMNRPPSMAHQKRGYCCKFHRDLEIEFRKQIDRTRHIFFEILVEQYKSEFGNDDPRVADAQEMLASSYIDVKNWKGARAQLTSALYLRNAAKQSTDILHRSHKDTSTIHRLMKILNELKSNALDHSFSRKRSNPRRISSIRSLSLHNKS